MLETIKSGNKGNLVKVAQYMTGFAPIKEADGIFDDKFSDHVFNWQVGNNLEPDRVIGKESWTKLAKTAPTCSTTKNRTSVYTCAIQILLGGLEVDGIYGKNTKNAVASFQAANGLTVDGICGPKSWAVLIDISESKSDSTTSGGKVINNCVYYCQWDSRWSKIKYSTHTSAQTIGNSGCGTTSAAMVVATFADKSVTPVEMSALAVEKGYRTWDSGTDPGFFLYIADKYEKISQMIPTKSIPTMKSALAQGALVIVNVNSADNHFWTTQGHYIVMVGYDDAGYIYANDPNKTSHPRKQKEDKFKLCVKGAWILWPSSGSDPEPEPVPEPTPAVGTRVVIRGGDCNVRSIASTSGRILGVAKEGTVMTYAGQTAANGWLSVSSNWGAGWVSNKYGFLE